MYVGNVSKISKESKIEEPQTDRTVDKKVETCLKLERNQQKNKTFLLLNHKKGILLKTRSTI